VFSLVLLKKMKDSKWVWQTVENALRFDFLTEAVLDCILLRFVDTIAS
jgi:hypothetical protein